MVTPAWPVVEIKAHKKVTCVRGVPIMDDMSNEETWTARVTHPGYERTVVVEAAARWMTTRFTFTVTPARTTVMRAQWVHPNGETEEATRVPPAVKAKARRLAKAAR